MPPRQIVLASAGSGKTFWISSRMIELLAYGVPPEEVLGATFTRTAAGEILDRILKRLAEGASSLPAARKLSLEVFADRPQPFGADQWARTLENLIRNLHRVNIGTLDSFFMKSATAFAGELGLPPRWRIMDEATGLKMASEGLSEVLASIERERMVELVRLISRGNVSRSVHRSLAGMMDQMLEMEEQLDPDVADPWGAFSVPPGAAPLPTRLERDALAGELRSLRLPMNKKGNVSKDWQKAVDKVCRLLDSADWDGITKETLCSAVVAGDAELYRGPIPPEVEHTVLKVLAAARAALRPRLADQMQALKEVTRGYAQVFRKLQEQRGLFGFRDVTRLIGQDDGVGQRVDFFYRLDARTRHALLDEFQDTSLAQWEALRPIVGEVLADEDRAAVIVADPKQSIYGWRGAEPDVVHAVASHYALDQRVLARSWRSSPVVLEFVNHIFGGIAANPVLDSSDNHSQTAAAWSRDFSPHTAEHQHLPGFVRVEVGPADETRGNKRPNLLKHAAKKIAELHQSSPNATIGVLTRTNQAVARLFLELRALDIAVSQEGGNPLTDSAPCEAILALLRLVDHPGDSISRYHVAETPIGKVLGYTDFKDESAAGKLASQVRKRLQTEGYGGTISRIAKLLAPFCEPREARRLGQLCELAYRYEESATLRTSDFIRLVETQRVEDRASARVRVMTVHQAKGLEFDIVVLPQLDATLFGAPRYAPAIPYREDPGGRITAVFPFAAVGIRGLFPELEPAFRQREAGLLRDGLSALYVSLTRARHALLIIIAPDPANGVGSTKSPAKLIRHALASSPILEQVSAGMVLHQSGEEDWYSTSALASLETVPPPAQVAVQLQLPEGSGAFRRQTPSSLHGDAKVDVRELLRIDNSDALLRGSLVHAWFERIEWLEDGRPTEADLLGCGREVAPLAPEAKLRELLRDFFGWLDRPSVREILSAGRYPSDVVVERELPFMHRSGDVLMEGAIDRLVISYDGTHAIAAEIIDYKSDRTETGSASITSLTRRYAPQLRAYREAVSAMYRIPLEACSATLVFLEAGRLVEVGAEVPGGDELEEADESAEVTGWGEADEVGLPEELSTHGVDSAGSSPSDLPSAAAGTDPGEANAEDGIHSSVAPSAESDAAASAFLDDVRHAGLLEMETMGMHGDLGDATEPFPASPAEADGESALIVEDADLALDAGISAPGPDDGGIRPAAPSSPGQEAVRAESSTSAAGEPTGLSDDPVADETSTRNQTPSQAAPPSRRRRDDPLQGSLF